MDIWGGEGEMLGVLHEIAVACEERSGPPEKKMDETHS